MITTVFGLVFLSLNSDLYLVHVLFFHLLPGSQLVSSLFFSPAPMLAQPLSLLTSACSQLRKITTLFKGGEARGRGDVWCLYFTLSSKYLQSPKYQYAQLSASNQTHENEEWSQTANLRMISRMSIKYLQ